MKSANNSALFTNVSAEESSTVNGGLFGYRPIYRQRIVYNRFGRPMIQYYIQWVSGNINTTYLDRRPY
ncbi:MAG: hypothetical protein HC836_26895 [Richelia sp. RM2_1_2]|nr:hypothetical protein [Richelia sp. RM2_1_2]